VRKQPSESVFPLQGRSFGKHEHVQHVAIDPGILVKKVNWQRPF